MSESKLLQNIIGSLEKKMENNVASLKKNMDDLEVVTRVCSNLANHLSSAVEGAKSRESVEDSYKTLLANIQVILTAVINEPEKMKNMISSSESKIEVYGEVLNDIKSRVKKQEELVSKIESGDISKPRKPGQRPESLKAIRDARGPRESETVTLGMFSSTDDE